MFEGITGDVVMKNIRPLNFDEFIQLMNLSFKLFGRTYTQKQFDKFKRQYYTEDTGGCLITGDLSYIEKNPSKE